MSADNERESLVEELRRDTMAVKLTQTKFGRRRSLNADQTAEAAAVFETDPDWLRGSKQLLNYRHEAYKAVTNVLGRARRMWMDMTVPYPEDGIRLMKRSRLAEWEEKMGGLVDELGSAVVALDGVYQSDLLPEARARLKDLFSAADYPSSLVGLFRFDWEYPSCEPPNFLQQLNPELYEAEQRRAAARFDQAIGLMEDAFLAEFQEIVQNLSQRLTPQPVNDWVYEGPIEMAIRARMAEIQPVELVSSPDEPDAMPTPVYAEEQLAELATLEAQLPLAMGRDVEQRDHKVSWRPAGGGKTQRRTYESAEAAEAELMRLGCRKTNSRTERRRFKEAAVANLSAFFDRFQQLSIRSNADLDALVEQAKNAVQGVDANALRQGDAADAVRETLRSNVANLATALDGMMESRGGGRRINLGSSVEE